MAQRVEGGGGMSFDTSAVAENEGIAIGPWRVKINAFCQWPEWMPWTRYNWRNADLLRVSLEVDHMLGGDVEIDLALLGLVLHVEVYNAVSRNIALQPLHEKRLRVIDFTGDEPRDITDMLDGDAEA